MSLKPWHEIMTPHDNIRAGKVKQSDFAASLADVLDANGNPDYYDPVRFFDRTYLTQGLRLLAGEVVGRLTGQGDGDAVIQIQTPFGGGKTHTLICLYHLVHNAEACFNHPALKTYWLERGWGKPPAVRVGAFDGNHIGTSPVEVAPGLTIQTMWGHLAWQLAGLEGYKLVAQPDQERVSPGGQEIDALLKLAGGGLIILDEVANYIEKAAGVQVRDSTLRAQTLTFLQTLAGRAGAHERVVVAATLPRSHLEVHGSAASDALDRLQKVFGRVQKVREPVEGDEVHEIIRRRLFLETGKSTGQKAVIHEYAEDLKKRPNLPDEVRESSYRRRFEQSYPFHPFLLDILNRYIGANPKFQRTRGALRLLALVIADLYKKKHSGALIHPTDIDLENEEIRSELLELVDKEFRSAIEADIVGKGANAREMDRQSTQMGQWRIATGLATTAFLFTCEAGNRSKGASAPELNLAAARPDIDFGLLPGVILQMKERFHFINTEGDRYRFSTTPNLNRILLDARTGVDDAQVTERILTELRNVVRQGKGTPLEPYFWPEAPQSIPDSISNKLVLMPTDQRWGATTRKETQETVLQLLNHAGTSRRVRRNTLVFVLPDETDLTVLNERVRALLAAESVHGNQSRYNLSKEQISQLDAERVSGGKGVRQQVLRTWRHVAWGGMQADPPDGDEAESSSEAKSSSNQPPPLTALDMGQPPAGTDKTLTDLVVQFLKDRQKYLETLAPMLITHPTKLRVWPAEELSLSLLQLRDYFRQFTHLPILKDEDVLKTAVAGGVEQGFFALAQGTNAEDAVELYFKKALSPTGVFLQDGYVLLRPSVIEDRRQKEALRRKQEEERKRLEDDKRREDEKRRQDEARRRAEDEARKKAAQQEGEEETGETGHEIIVDGGGQDDGGGRIIEVDSIWTGGEIRQPKSELNVDETLGDDEEDLDDDEREILSPEDEGVGGKGDAQPASRPRKVSIDVEVPFERFHNFQQGIVNSLGRAADRIRIRVSVEASCQEGFSTQLLEDTVRETLYNLFKTDEALKLEE